MIQFIDLIVVALVYVGNYYKVNKNPVGWAISGLTASYWLARACGLGLYAQAIGHVISLCIATYAYNKWRKDEGG